MGALNLDILLSSSKPILQVALSHLDLFLVCTVLSVVSLVSILAIYINIQKSSDTYWSDSIICVSTWPYFSAFGSCTTIFDIKPANGSRLTTVFILYFWGAQKIFNFFTTYYIAIFETHFAVFFKYFFRLIAL